MEPSGLHSFIDGSVQGCHTFFGDFWFFSVFGAPELPSSAPELPRVPQSSPEFPKAPQSYPMFPRETQERQSTNSGMTVHKLRNDSPII